MPVLNFSQMMYIKWITLGIMKQEWGKVINGLKYCSDGTCCTLLICMVLFSVVRTKEDHKSYTNCYSSVLVVAFNSPESC